VTEAGLYDARINRERIDLDRDVDCLEIPARRSPELQAAAREEIERVDTRVH